jgi:AraC-like DNA-binding protein
MPVFHMHDNYEIALVLTDTVNFFVNDKIYIINADSLLVFNETDLHRSICTINHPYNRYIIEISPEFVRSLSTSQSNLLACFSSRKSGSSPIVHLSPEISANLQHELDLCIAYNNSKKYGDDILSRIQIEKVLVMINIVFASDLSYKPIHIDKDFNRIQPIIQYIQDNLHQNLSIDRLSNFCFISSRQLTHLFKKTTGFTVNEYITLSRINRSKSLLMANQSINIISEFVGFNSDSHFIRTFHKIMGISPKKYAAQYRSSVK